MFVGIVGTPERTLMVVGVFAGQLGIPLRLERQMTDA
jgi:hypothetical protein